MLAAPETRAHAYSVPLELEAHLLTSQASVVALLVVISWDWLCCVALWSGFRLRACPTAIPLVLLPRSLFVLLCSFLSSHFLRGSRIVDVRCCPIGGNVRRED